MSNAGLTPRGGVRILATISAMLFLSFFVCGAEAHMYFSFPSNHSPGAGTVSIDTTFAINPPVADESGEGALKYDLEGWTVNSGSLSARSPAAFEYTGDSRRSLVSVPGDEASVFVTSADYANDEVYEGVTYHQEFTLYSKAFINLGLGDGEFSKEAFLAFLPSGLEIVPLTDLAGVSPSSEVRVKVLKDGVPLSDADVYVTQEGAPFTDLNGEITALRKRRTGSDGTAAFVMPSCSGPTYFYAMYLDPGTTDTAFYGMMSSLSFEISAPFGAGATELLTRPGGRGTNMEFVGANTYASMRDYLYMIGALDLVSEPSGAISRVSGKAGQIGDIGAAFEVPMDVTGARSAGGVPLKGVTGTEQRVNFSRELVGDAAFDGMVAFLKNVMEERDENPQYELTERGEFYVAPTPKDFLGRFGISVMGSFSGGEARDVGGILQLGVELNDADFEAGNIYGLLGGMFADSGPADGADWYDATEMFVGPDPHYRFAIVYDGAYDNKLDFAYWAVREDEGGSGSGGCSAGALIAAPLFALAGAVYMMRRRSGARGGFGM